MKRNIRLTCPWCKQKQVIKTIHQYGFPIWQCRYCGSWCGDIYVYIKKRIKYLFK